MHGTQELFIFSGHWYLMETRISI
jgi:hypothetical protein